VGGFEQRWHMKRKGFEIPPYQVLAELIK